MAPTFRSHLNQPKHYDENEDKRLTIFGFSLGLFDYCRSA
jgi:hypothetical protein